MNISELCIHKMDKNAPKVIVVDYNNFSTVEINTGDGTPVIRFFLYSPQQVVNFKNNFLCAVERPIRIGR